MTEAYFICANCQYGEKRGYNTFCQKFGTFTTQLGTRGIGWRSIKGCLFFRPKQEQPAPPAGE